MLSQIMGGDEEQESLADIIFERSEEQKTRGEMGLGTILGFLVPLSSPSGYRGAIVLAAAAVVFILPILRAIVRSGKYSNEENFLRRTVRFLEVSALVCVVHLLDVAAGQYVAPYVPFSGVELTLIVTVAVTLLFILSFEVLMKTYRFSWGTVYYVRRLALDGLYSDLDLTDITEIFDYIWGSDGYRGRFSRAFSLLNYALMLGLTSQVSYFLLRDSIPDREEDALEQLREYVNRNSGPGGNEGAMGIVLAVVFSAIVLVPIFLVISWMISLVFEIGLGIVLLSLFIMLLVKHMVGMWYIAFGHMEYEYFIASNRIWLAQTAGYTLAVYIPFFYF